MAEHKSGEKKEPIASFLKMHLFSHIDFFP